MMNSFDLVWPALEHLESYKDALQRGWYPDTMRPSSAQDELTRIAANSELFIRQQYDPDGKGPPVTLPDGSTVQRIPGYRRWIWDGEFCGSVGFRWQPRTTELPPHVLGHVGYNVVPWKRRRGYATRALGMLLHDIRASGLPFVELTTNPDNIASQRVIEANGGELVERFNKIAAHGGGEALRWRIHLNPQPR
jgi:predicted acetyltransferase